jgi:hypothetical protein
MPDLFMFLFMAGAGSVCVPAYGQTCLQIFYHQTGRMDRFLAGRNKKPAAGQQFLKRAAGLPAAQFPVFPGEKQIFRPFRKTMQTERIKTW